MKQIAYLLLIVATSLPLLSQAAQYTQSPRFARQAKPKRVLLLKLQMLVAELSAGGVVQRIQD